METNVMWIFFLLIKAFQKDLIDSCSCCSVEINICVISDLFSVTGFIITFQNFQLPLVDWFIPPPSHEFGSQ
jgi:hypothetical protein